MARLRSDAVTRGAFLVHQTSYGTATSQVTLPVHDFAVSLRLRLPQFPTGVTQVNEIAGSPRVTVRARALALDRARNGHTEDVASRNLSIGFTIVEAWRKPSGRSTRQARSLPGWRTCDGMVPMQPTSPGSGRSGMSARFRGRRRKASERILSVGP